MMARVLLVHGAFNEFWGHTNSRHAGYRRYATVYGTTMSRSPTTTSGSVFTGISFGENPAPLAWPTIFKRLEPPAIDGKGQWPGSVKRWVNMRAIGDKAAAVALREKFGPHVEEVLVDNGHRAHDPEPYLNSPATGAAIAAALA
jgi:hypothetical protein